jgi:hypothetical protein
MNNLQTLLRSVISDYSLVDVPALSDRIKAMFDKREYSHLEMEAALCVWECINDWTLLPDVSTTSRPDWIELREGVGSVEMRHQSIALGKWCLKIYDICTKHDEDFFDLLSYDWEVIPMMLDYACDDEGKQVIYEDAFPASEKVALLVAHRVLFDHFKRDCRHESDRQWGYRELVEDHPERVVQAFALGETPAVFVTWLGEKYDLSPKGPWS